MSDQSKLGLGQIITTEQQRDAIHIAVAPVTAAHTMIAGRHVGLDADGNASEHTASQIGVIDPFLKRTVEKGQKCWLYLYPGSITSLRHEWTHPAMPSVPVGSGATDPEGVSKRWLEDYAARQNSYDDPSAAYDRLMKGMRTGELYFYGSDLHSFSELEEADELAHHYERVTGQRVNWSNFSFSCSC